MRKFEKQFRIEHPETIGEKDSHFDLDNYTEWLESQISEPNPKPSEFELKYNESLLDTNKRLQLYIDENEARWNEDSELQPVNTTCPTCGYPLTLQGNGIAERICTCNKLQPVNKTDLVSKEEMFEFLRWALLLDVYYRDGVGFGMGEFKQWLQDADLWKQFKNRNI